MKSAELKDLSLAELKDKLTEVEQSLQKLRFKISTDEEKNVAAVRTQRRDRARIKQVLADKSREAAKA